MHKYRNHTRLYYIENAKPVLTYHCPEEKHVYVHKERLMVVINNFELITRIMTDNLKGEAGEKWNKLAS